MSEIVIYGEIGWEVTAAEVVAHLQDCGDDDLIVRINSPGGDVYDGLSIMNALRAHPGSVTAVVEGLAASAASFIAVGGAHRVVMRPTAELMVHDAMSFVGGNADEMLRAITDLERISDNLAGIYATKAGGEAGDWRALMKAETWYSAKEAVDIGLADAVEDGRKLEATTGRRMVMNRFRYQNRRDAPAPTVNSPEGQNRKEGSHMTVLNDLAQSLGMSEDGLSAALRTISAEHVAVTTEVDLEYPEVEVVPTGTVTATPVGDVPEAVSFTVDSAPVGWEAEVEEASGVVTITAPAGVEPGDQGEIIVSATGADEPVSFTISVTVKAAAEQSDEPGTSTPAAPGSPGDDRVVLDRDTYNDLQAAAKLGWEAKNTADAAARVAEVDQWISEGRVNVARRAKVIAAMDKNPEDARDLYGSIPKNTIPRGEIGHGQDNEAGSVVNSMASLSLTDKLDKAGMLTSPNVY